MGFKIATRTRDQAGVRPQRRNQQKVIAKWLCTENRILIFDGEPRGIDVAEIYPIGAADRGRHAILVVSRIRWASRHPTSGDM